MYDDQEGYHDPAAYGAYAEGRLPESGPIIETPCGPVPLDLVSPATRAALGASRPLLDPPADGSAESRPHDHMPHELALIERAAGGERPAEYELGPMDYAGYDVIELDGWR